MVMSRYDTPSASCTTGPALARMRFLLRARASCGRSEAAVRAADKVRKARRGTGVLGVDGEAEHSGVGRDVEDLTGCGEGQVGDAKAQTMEEGGAGGERTMRTALGEAREILAIGHATHYINVKCHSHSLRGHGAVTASTNHEGQNVLHSQADGAKYSARY